MTYIRPTTKQVLREVFRNRAITDAILGGIMLVVGGVILVITLGISTSIMANPAFACPQNDSSCVSARNLIGVIPIVASAVLIISGVWMLFPNVRGGGGPS